MNDKIDGLFNEAIFDESKVDAFNVYHPYIPLQISDQPFHYGITTEQYHKFAKLIIKECIGDFEKKITRRYAGDQKSMDVGYGMELVIDSIKRKFGVL